MKLLKFVLRDVLVFLVWVLASIFIILGALLDLLHVPIPEWADDVMETIGKYTIVPIVYLIDRLK